MSPGDAAQLGKETPLYEGPSKASRSFGILPLGTLLTLSGEIDGNFLEVEVQLEDGLNRGWILEESLHRPSDQPAAAAAAAAPATAKPEHSNRRRRMVVPRDEGLLIRREPSFYYGLYALGNLCFIDAAQMPSKHSGLGFSGGASIGYFVQKNLSIGLDGGYSVINGNDLDSTVINVGLIDLGLSLAYHFDDFEVFGGLQYSIGAGIIDLPTQLNAIRSASEFSSLWFLTGVGYRVQTGQMTSLAFRARYGGSLSRDLIGFQTISLGAYFEIRG